MNNRNIRAQPFAWTTKEAWEMIETLNFKQQASCKLLYVALSIISKKQKNAKKISTYKFTIAKYASVSEKTVQRYLQTLEDIGVIIKTEQPRSKNGRYEKIEITLCDTVCTDGHFGDRSETDQRQMEDTESDSSKKTTKAKKTKKVLPSKSFFDQDLFENFWNAYGKKRGKKICIDIWKRKNIDSRLADIIIKSAKEYADVTEVKFRKDPERWLRDERWEDCLSDNDLPSFAERTLEQHAKEYATYPEHAMQTFRRKYKDELPPQELHELAMQLEDIVYP